MATTYSPTTKCSTIGAVGLNFSVRDGKRWNPNAMITWISDVQIVNFHSYMGWYIWICRSSYSIYFSFVIQARDSRMYSSIFATLKKSLKKSFRAISTAWLNILLCVHLQPINVVVYNDPLTKSNLVASFALRCFQRLSLPDADTQRCAWRHNWYTGGQSVTVLSY